MTIDIPAACTPEGLDAAGDYYGRVCACGHVLLFHVTHDHRGEPPGECGECGCARFAQRVRGPGPEWPPIGADAQFIWLGKPCRGVVIGSDSHGVKVLLGAGPTRTWLPRSTLLGPLALFRVVPGRG